MPHCGIAENVVAPRRYLANIKGFRQKDGRAACRTTGVLVYYCFENIVGAFGGWAGLLVGSFSKCWPSELFHVST